jgi:FkbM family methyltransferase
MKPFVFSAWCAKWYGKWQGRKSFLRKVSGLIHIGANVGQERSLYAIYNLRVAWIEPIPDVFEQLCENLRPFPKQQAYQYLIAGEDGRTHTLHIANNEGASSSILELRKHREMWPEIAYTGEIQMCGTTLSKFIEKENLRLADYQAVVLDTQGSELMILKGAADLLPHFRFIRVEVPDFESYSGCCQLAEVDEFMRSHGFRERHRETFRVLPGVGAYHDVTYERLGRRRE